MAWSTVTFGRNKGKTLPQIIFADPDWFFWAVEENIFENKGPLRNEASNLDRRARAIRIPNNPHHRLLAEYVFYPPYGTFSELHIVRADTPLHEGASPTTRMRVIDLSVPRSVKGYDKLGYELIIRDVKRILFGDATFRMTRQRCEQFFDNVGNFEL